MRGTRVAFAFAIFAWLAAEPGALLSPRLAHAQMYCLQDTGEVESCLDMCNGSCDTCGRKPGFRWCGTGYSCMPPNTSCWKWRGGDHVERWQGDANCTCHKLTFRNFVTAPLSNADAVKIAKDATMVLQNIDGPGDVACNAVLYREGLVTSFSDGDGSIDTQAEFNLVIGLPGHVKVVNQINWCQQVTPNVIGCSPLPGRSISVIRFRPGEGDIEGILAVHEFGHNKGLPHRADANAVMNAGIGSRRFVNAAECSAFRSPSILAAETQMILPANSGAAPLEIRAFVRQIFIHGVPYEQAARYDSSVVPILIEMLYDEAELPYWPNIVVVLGMIGDERAVGSLISFIDANVAGELAAEHYTAKTSALMALGYLINKTGNREALDYLKKGLDPKTWAAKGELGKAPFQATAAERDFDFSKFAILGLALSGKREAADALLALQRPAETESERAFRTKVGDLVSEALVEHEKVASEGLANYYRQTQP